MLILGMYLQIVHTKGEWIKRKSHFALFCLLLVLATMMRYNAMLFTVPLLISVIVFYMKSSKARIILLVGTIFVYLVINIGVNLITNPRKAEYRTMETTGLGMVVMGSAITEVPDQLSEDIKTFMYDVAPPEIWMQQYRLGHWNTVKWSGSSDWSPIEDAGINQMMIYTLKTFLQAPRQAVRAVAAVTSMLWQLDGEVRWYYFDGFAAKEFNRYPSSG